MTDIYTLRDAALTSAINAAHAVKHTAIEIQGAGFSGGEMDRMRKQAEKCLKSIHEYQAYVNAENCIDTIEGVGYGEIP